MNAAATALAAIAWAGMIVLSVGFIEVAWGNVDLVRMFPEGWRWWMPWLRLLSLIPFAALILFNPFGV